MNHYEIVFMVHPDQSDQVPAMIQRFTALVESDGGKVHRLEDWGRRQLAYAIKNLQKAHYVLMNIECSPKALEEINYSFRYNDAIIRSLLLKEKTAITTPSALLKPKESKDFYEGRASSREEFV